MGIESAAGKAGRDIKWQMKYLGLSMMLLRDTLGITW